MNRWSRPRGDVIQDWYQRNGIALVTQTEDCSGKMNSAPPLGVSLGRDVSNAENFKVRFRCFVDGTPMTRPCDDGSEAPRHITHVTIDGDAFIWGQITKKIVSDIENLAR